MGQCDRGIQGSKGETVIESLLFYKDFLEHTFRGAWSDACSTQEPWFGLKDAALRVLHVCVFPGILVKIFQTTILSISSLSSFFPSLP